MVSHMAKQFPGGWQSSSYLSMAVGVGLSGKASRFTPMIVSLTWVSWNSRQYFPWGKKNLQSIPLGHQGNAYLLPEGDPSPFPGSFCTGPKWSLKNKSSYHQLQISHQSIPGIVPRTRLKCYQLAFLQQPETGLSDLLVGLILAVYMNIHPYLIPQGYFGFALADALPFWEIGTWVKVMGEEGWDG